MSNTKTVMSQAANTLVKPLEVEDVFSTYLYEGNSSTQTITNGIDLDGEGGLVWFKKRDSTYNHVLQDTARGAGVDLYSNLDVAEINYYGSYGISSFNSDGFSLVGAGTATNQSGGDYASWTFRKAPKFFDVVTYTGDGTAGRTISHNLGSEVGMIVVKRTDATAYWAVYHRGVAADPETDRLYLNTNSTAGDNKTFWNDTLPSDSVFTLGNSVVVNASGANYVAYLFAHNDGDGEFGPDGDADIIKCGSYTGNGSNDGPEIDLGFEPQWLMVKAASASGDWKLYDSMRGLNASGASDYFLEPNTTDIEDLGNYYAVTPTGFKLTDNTFFHNSSGETYIYIAIRRGTKVPESGTEVFAPDFNYNTNTNYQAYLGAPADMWLGKNPSSFWPIVTRLTGGNYLRTNENSAETSSTQVVWDNMLGYNESSGTPDTSRINYVWKRAPNFFDVVAYTGDGTAGRTVSHNLGVAPEMMWVKSRNNTASWVCYHKDIGNTKAIYLNSTNAATTASSGWWNNTTPTDSVFTLGANTTQTSNDYIAYLFASLDGVSKVFSVTKSSGSDASVDCGFSSGPRLVMLKRTDSTGDWYIWDTERGIVAGNDPYLLLNSTAAEVTSTDYIDPTSNGFTIVNGGLADGDYIGYAVA